MILFPPSKINLGLNIKFKREDGYHELESCMLPIPFVDVLEILPAASFSFTQTGLTIPGNSDDNLCIKAYKLMLERYSILPVYIHLRKEIPMGAGLGGGSSDAAYVLKGINSLYELNIPSSKLEELAAELGSDCAFFIKNEAQIAKGRGELLSTCLLDLSDHFIKIVNPGIHVGTKEAFAGLDFDVEKYSIRSILEKPIENWKNELRNDFEKSVFKIHPILEKIKDNLYLEGAVYASMTGSGSTLFGIYKKEPGKSFEKEGYLEVIRKL